MARRVSAFLMVPVIIALGCTSEREGVQGTPSSPIVHSENHSTRLDISTVISRAHFAFRAEQGEWSGGHTTYDVKTAGGSFSFSPYGPSKRHAPRQEHGAAATIQTISVHRDGTPESFEKPRLSLASDGHLIIDRGSIREALGNTESGLEQSWTFTVPPHGRGDLQITLRIEGEQYAGESQTGLHFIDSVTGLGLRYGRATWIDAKGVHCEVVPRYAEGHIVLRVPASFVDRAAYPVTLDPTIGPEIGIDAPILGAEAPDWLQGDVTTIAAGAQYVAAWTDLRSGDFQIIGARLARSGAVLDPTGVVLVDKAYGPTFASDGSRILLAWTADSGTSIDAAFVDLSTSLGIGTPIVVSSNPDSSRFLPSVAFDGVEYLVAWQDQRGVDSDIYGARLSATGVVRDPDGTLIAGAGGDQTRPSIAGGASQWLVVWKTGSSPTHLVGARIADDGMVLDAAGLPLASIVTDPSPYKSVSLAHDGTNYRVAWSDGSVRTARVSQQGALLDPAGVTVATSGLEPTMACGGTSCAMVWGGAGIGLLSDRFRWCSA